MTWSERNLDELAELRNGKTIRKRDYVAHGPIPVMGSNGLIGFCGDVLYESSVITIGRVGACGALHRTPEQSWVSDNAIVAEPKSGTDQDFLFYLLHTVDFSALLKGTTQPLITQGDLKRLTFMVPGIEEQRAIACVLGALDDKIELNTETNRTLEATAQAIFRSWFVDFDPVVAKLALSEAEGADGRKPFGITDDLAALFPDHFVDSALGPIPEGWKVSTLGEVSKKPQYGLTASAIEWTRGPRFLRIADINKRPWIEWGSVPGCELTGEETAKYQLFEGDLVIARIADPGHAALITEPPLAVFASYLIRFRPHSEAIGWFLRAWTKSIEYWNLVHGRKSGSTRFNLNAKVLSAFPLLQPSREVLRGFMDATQPLVSQIDQNVRESQTLAALRDLLLPKLLSGEIRVGEADVRYEAARKAAPARRRRYGAS